MHARCIYTTTYFKHKQERQTPNGFHDFKSVGRGRRRAPDFLARAENSRAGGNEGVPVDVFLKCQPRAGALAPCLLAFSLPRARTRDSPGWRFPACFAAPVLVTLEGGVVLAVGGRLWGGCCLVVSTQVGLRRCGHANPHGRERVAAANHHGTAQGAHDNGVTDAWFSPLARPLTSGSREAQTEAGGGNKRATAGHVLSNFEMRSVFPLSVVFGESGVVLWPGNESSELCILDVAGG